MCVAYICPRISLSAAEELCGRTDGGKQVIFRSQSLPVQGLSPMHLQPSGLGSEHSCLSVSRYLQMAVRGRSGWQLQGTTFRLIPFCGLFVSLPVARQHTCGLERDRQDPFLYGLCPYVMSMGLLRFPLALSIYLFSICFPSLYCSVCKCVDPACFSTRRNVSSV